MEFRCLGPLEVRGSDGIPIDLGGPQQRLVLAQLLQRNNAVVSVDQLIDGLWGEAPPASARKIIQGYVSQLRKVISDGATLGSRLPGYVLEVDSEAVDAERFERLVQEGTATVASHPGRARELLAEALGMWRGQPYQDLSDSDALRSGIVHLEQLYLAAQEARVAADIYAGNEASVVPELEELTHRYPLRERLWALRMLALYRTGRQADALRVYENCRVTLAEEVGLEPGSELRLLEQRILEQDSILETIGALEPDGPEIRGTGRNPYKGLRPFTEQDADDFYGRRDLIRRLSDAIESRKSSRLVVLAGPSGCGKSSVVHAGLLPLLREAGRDVVTIYPGSMPLQKLEETIGSLTRGRSPLLVVDQLEEIFSLPRSEDQSGFLDALAEAATAPEGLTVVVTVRTDFLDRVLMHPRFASLVEPGLVLVTPLQDHEVRELVVQPARRVGAAVDPDVVAGAVNFVARRPSALPLVEYALTDLFDRSKGETLTQAALEAAGGISGALVQRAEEVYGSLDETRRATIRTLLLRLVSVTEDGTPVRRRVPTNTLRGLPEALDLGKLLGDYRLLTFDRGPDGIGTVEVAHEALLREWPRLRVWVDEARDALRRHEQLSEAAAEWAGHDRADEYLLTGHALARLADWSQADLLLNETEQTFVTASLAAETEIHNRRQRRRRLVLAGFGAAAVIALGLALTALVARNEAQSQAARAQSESAQAAAAAELAEAEAQRAFANELSAAAVSVIEEDPELALLLSLRAITSNPDPEVPLDHKLTLRRAMNADRLVERYFITPPTELLGLDLAPDGSLLAVWTPGRLLQLDPRTWKPEWILEDDELVSIPTTPRYAGTPVFSPDSELVAIGTLGTPARLLVLDSATGALVHEVRFEGICRAHTGPQSWSGDGKYIGVSLQEDCDRPFGTATLRILDTTTWDGVIEFATFGQAVFAENASRMATVEYADGLPGRKARVFDTDTFEQLAEVAASVGDLHPDGRLLAVADPDGQSVMGSVVIDIYDLNTGQIVDRLTGLDNRPIPYAMDFVRFPDGYALVVGTDGQTTGIWNAESGRLVRSLSTGVVYALGYDRATERLYTADPGGAISSWDFSPGGQASPDSLSYPYWFDADGFSVNPHSKIGVAMHWGTPQHPIESFATFDTDTGVLQDTLVQEIGHIAVSALPGGRAIFLLADATAGTVGPLVVWDSETQARTDFIGCVISREAWGADPAGRSHQDQLPDQPVCLDEGTPFIATTGPVLSADGTEVMVADVNGTGFLWDAFSLDEIDRLDLGGVAGGPVWIEALGVDWFLIRRIDREEFLALDRSSLEIIGRFEFPLSLNAEVAPDGSFLIMRRSDTSLYRVDTADWEPRLLYSPGQFVRGLALSPQGDRLMLGGTDGFTRIVDAETGGLLDQIPIDHVSDGHWVDQDHIAVGTGQTGLWTSLTFDFDEVLVRAGDQLTRSFTTDECRIYRIDPCPSLDQVRATARGDDG